MQKRKSLCYRSEKYFGRKFSFRVNTWEQTTETNKKKKKKKKKTNGVW